MKITKKATKEFVKEQLKTNKVWTLKGLTTIYANQTTDEQAYGGTSKLNDIGFSGVDGDILSSFATQYQTKGYLSPKQMVILTKKMPKYWKQIIAVSDVEKLKGLIEKSLK
jgi:hypothetical protein